MHFISFFQSSVQILGLIKDILPHVAALNQLSLTKDGANQANLSGPRLRPIFESFNKKLEQIHNEERGSAVTGVGNQQQQTLTDNQSSEAPTTSSHYCVVESEHPYRSATVNCYRVEFPACVQWMTIEFDTQCGTAQLEDYLLVSLPIRPMTSVETTPGNEDYYDILDNNVKTNRGLQSKSANLMTTCYKISSQKESLNKSEPDWFVVKKFNT